MAKNEQKRRKGEQQTGGLRRNERCHGDASLCEL